jgi:ABC-type Fe3+/spermidine/putrescine transport system ATPase subunit
MREGRIEQVGTAREIYERPATAFVAGFVGRTNLLRGTHDGEGRTRLAGGLALHVADARGAAPGAAIALSVRPHRILVVPDATPARDRGWNVVAGAVVRVAYFGDALDVQVRADGGTGLRLTALPEAGLAVGQPVTLAIPPEACVVLPPE